MPDSPSTKNYTLGKGKLYFNKKDPATGVMIGERDLGNAPAVAFNLSLEALEHFSSRGGLKAKDKKIINQVTPGFNFTLDEVNAANLAMLMMSDVTDVDNLAADGIAKALIGVKPGYYYDLGARSVGMDVLGYDGGSVIFAVGETVAGGTSGATAVVVQVVGDSTSGTLYLKDISGGPFGDDDVLTGNAAGTPGAAVANGPSAFIPTAVSVEDADAAGTFFTAGTDFTVDSQSGRLYIKPGGAINGTTVTNLSVVFSSEAHSYKEIKGLSQTELTGELRFVSDNPVGNQLEMQIWSVSLMPTGDTALIGEEWSTLGFEGEILKDEVGHPDNPYLKMVVIPAV